MQIRVFLQSVTQIQLSKTAYKSMPLIDRYCILEFAIICICPWACKKCTAGSEGTIKYVEVVNALYVYVPLLL